MSDVMIDYNLIQELIDLCNAAKGEFEAMAYAACPIAHSDDPIAKHHYDTVKPQEQALFVQALAAFGNVRDGAQNAYDAFKAADAVGGR